MTSAVAARTQPQPAPEPNTTPMPDPRRITEHDPGVAALRAAWRMKLTRSVGLLARSLRALPPHASAEPALTAFIHGHVALLRSAYVDGHDLGATDYYHGVSRQPTSWARTVTTDDRQERRRLAFYAPSVAKMAHEALLAWQQERASLIHTSERETTTLTDETPSPLDMWQDGLGARLTLQADIMWSGLQDGYVAAGAGDAIGLYSLLYWILEPLARHCDGCLMYAAGNPYNAPGLGGNTLDTAPGAGQTECGAACKCSLSYASPGEIDQPFWNAVFEQWQKAYAVGVAAQQQVAAPVPTDTAVKPQTPRRAPFTIPLEPLEPLTLPSDGGGVPLSDEQKSALDLYRATALAWEEWRGGLPPLPKLFADLDNPSPDVNAWLEAMPSWMALSPKQQQILAQVYEAVADWTLATAEAEIGRQQQGTDDGQNLTFSGEGYNLYRDPHGRFAPGPHVPREEEGGGWKWQPVVFKEVTR